MRVISRMYTKPMKESDEKEKGNMLFSSFLQSQSIPGNFHGSSGEAMI